jgi:hypothetical protein
MLLYFSPLSVTDDKQLDRKHPFSFPQCRQGNMGLGGWGVFGGAVLGDLVDAVAWGSKIYTLRGPGWMPASRCVRCMQCLCCGFVLGRRGQLSRRSSIQVDEILVQPIPADMRLSLLIVYF